MQQKVSKVFITTNLEDMQTIDRALEEEADVFARNYLIPAKEFRTFSPSKYTSDAEIVSFANKIGIHPGIVAGRMQYDGIIKPNRCSQLKEKYYIEYGE
ncbi:MAG: hypothetical protein KBT27_12705 [Prevotellaceae bacterium]|nr:hypothetical protein [Candidatus Faecinaster equi]